MTDRTERLGKENLSRLILEFSIPAIIGMIVNAVYNVIDRIFIGNSVGALGIAGITVGFPVMMLQGAFGGTIGIGATSLISIRLGEKRKKDAELVLGNATILLVIIGILFCVIGLLFMDPLLRIFGADKEVLPYAKDYLTIILYGAIFQSLSFGMNNFIRAEGKPGIAMISMASSAVLNAILAPIFIFVLHWGMKGAALATLIAQLFAAVWIILFFVTGKSQMAIHVANFKLKISIVWEIITIGAAFFFMSAAQSIMISILNNQLLKYGGNVAISAMGIVNTLMTLIFMPVIGINQGTQPIIGYNHGAKNYDRVLKALKDAIIYSTIISILGFILIQAIPSQLISIFNHKDKELIKYGSHALTIFLMMIPLLGFQMVASGYFQAVGKPLQSTILNCLRQLIILIPALIILPNFFQMDGILYAGPLADFIAAIVTGIFIFVEIKKIRLNIKETAVLES